MNRISSFIILTILTALLGGAGTAAGQDTTALQPISEVPGNWVFLTDQTRLATFRSNDDAAGLFRHPVCL